MVHPKGLQVHVRRPKEAAYTALGVEPLRCGVWGEPPWPRCQRLGLGTGTGDYLSLPPGVKPRAAAACGTVRLRCLCMTCRLTQPSMGDETNSYHSSRAGFRAYLLAA